MCTLQVTRGGLDAEALCAAGSDVVGPAVADRGRRAARRFGRDRCAAGRSGAGCPDRGALAAGGGGAWVLDGGGRPSDDRDADLCASDDSQAALALGLRDALPRGVRLDPPAALLPNPVGRTAAGRVDDPQADPSLGRPDGDRVVPRGDRRGGDRAALRASRGEDRLDGGRGRRALPDRRGPGGRGGRAAGTRGRQAEAEGSGAARRSSRPRSATAPAPPATGCASSRAR